MSAAPSSPSRERRTETPRELAFIAIPFVGFLAITIFLGCMA